MQHKKVEQKREIAKQRSKKLKIVKDECERILKAREEEKKSPGGVKGIPRLYFLVANFNL